MTAKATLSVVLIAKNCETTLPDCLKSVQWADEIILLDSGSTDNTVSIAEEMGAKVYTNTDWQGYGRQRQIAQSYATCDYVFMIDTDEQITDELKNSINGILSKPKLSNTVYSCVRRNWFLGRYMMNCGWYPDRVIRLYLNHERSYSDRLVHESVDISKAKVEQLDGDILHKTCTNYADFQRKQLNYAEAWANDKFKQDKKISFISVLTHSLGAFIKTYFIRLGFKDGIHGLILSMINSQYTFNKYTMLWLLNNKIK